MKKNATKKIKRKSRKSLQKNYKVIKLYLHIVFFDGMLCIFVKKRYRIGVCQS